MVSAEILGLTVTLVFILVLEMINICRKMSSAGLAVTQSEWKLVDYPDKLSIFERILEPESPSTSSFFSAISPFAIMMFTIEMIIGYSVFVITSTTENSLFLVGSYDVYSVIALMSSWLLILIWVFLPMLVVPEYDRVRSARVLPFSITTHIFSTFVIIILLFLGSVLIYPHMAFIGIDISEYTVHNFIFSLYYTLLVLLVGVKVLVFQIQISTEISATQSLRGPAS
ncbi:hypothetical protein [Natrinema sp. CBA1119]|uniref:hypothetical protein n=1 Tax=Natrinema sp. CBA1119 TaxID=1608465 RepID=UPI001145A957|nr:hypothetical protein [Natrinema sp. CBA1119]